MMSISAEPSLVDQHSAVACSPAEPLWNQASASLSEKKTTQSSSHPKSSRVPFCIFKMKDKCWKITFEVSDLPAARAWSRGSAATRNASKEFTEITRLMSTMDSLSFCKSFFISPFFCLVYSRWTKAGTTTTSWMRRIGGRLKILQHWKQIEGNWCFDLEIIFYIQEMPYQKNTNLAGQGFFPYPMDGLRKNSARLFGGRGSPGSSNLASQDIFCTSHVCHVSIKNLIHWNPLVHCQTWDQRERLRD